MEKIKYLFLILFLVGCTSNDKAAVDYYLINKPLYDYDVEEKILNGELKSILRANIDSLNKQQLLVLQLYYVEELNVYEIAEVLSVSTGRVSQIKSAAVKALREMIESEVNA